MLRSGFAALAVALGGNAGLAAGGESSEALQQAAERFREEYCNVAELIDVRPANRFGEMVISATVPTGEERDAVRTRNRVLVAARSPYGLRRDRIAARGRPARLSCPPRPS